MKGVTNEFVEYVTQDLLSSLRGITARAMFGGFGIYKDGVMFGIVVDGELYFKVDDTNKICPVLSPPQAVPSDY